MAWTNPDLITYHGTDDSSAAAITASYPHSINLQKCRPLADFGPGFYVTTNRKQAENWANQRCRRLNARNPVVKRLATLLEFKIERWKLATLGDLVFVLEGPTTDYWDLVKHCRTGTGSNAGARGTNPYDVVFGPVSIWPQTLVVKDCDQISFHTDDAIALLQQPKAIKASGTYF